MGKEKCLIISNDVISENKAGNCKNGQQVPFNWRSALKILGGSDAGLINWGLSHQFMPHIKRKILIFLGIVAVVKYWVLKQVVKDEIDLLSK